MCQPGLLPCLGHLGAPGLAHNVSRTRQTHCLCYRRANTPLHATAHTTWHIRLDLFRAAKIKQQHVAAVCHMWKRLSCLTGLPSVASCCSSVQVVNTFTQHMLPDSADVQQQPAGAPMLLPTLNTPCNPTAP